MPEYSDILFIMTVHNWHSTSPISLKSIIRFITFHISLKSFCRFVKYYLTKKVVKCDKDCSYDCRDYENTYNK